MKRLLLCFLFQGLFYTSYAQYFSSVSPASGIIRGSGGSVTYNTGQALFTRAIGSGGVATSYLPTVKADEVVVQVSTELEGLAVTAYPNPTPDMVRFNLSNTIDSDLQYFLHTIDGKFLAGGRLLPATSISLETYYGSVFIISILKQGIVKKRIRIIKR